MGFDWDVGCEIPAIPGKFKQTKKLIKDLDGIGVKFLNINQLEVSETNAEKLEEQGLFAESDESFAVKGSGRTAEKLLEYCVKNTSLRVHYCTVKLKDGVQLKNRLIRRAGNISKDYDMITKEGLLLRGAIYPEDTYPSFDYSKMIKSIPPKKRTDLIKRLTNTREKIIQHYGIDNSLIQVDKEKLRILIGAWIIEEIAEETKKNGYKPVIIEEYPTKDMLITDLIAL